MAAKRSVSPSLLAVLVAGALGMSGCASSALSIAARDTLAKSSTCPGDQITVEELGSSRYRATGCGKSETYICKAAAYAVSSCIPESSVTPPPSGAPAN